VDDPAPIAVGHAVEGNAGIAAVGGQDEVAQLRRFWRGVDHQRLKPIQWRERTLTSRPAAGGVVGNGAAASNIQGIESARSNVEIEVFY